MSTLEILELIVLAVVVLVLGIYYLIKAIKNGWIKKLTETINTAIKEAEASGMSGNIKKKYVLEKVQEKCEELGIPYTLVYKLVSKLIDMIIANYNIIKKG